ncbi:MAG: methylmalonyl-CoA mutase family protein, partial [Phycisphaerales bacterium]
MTTAPRQQTPSDLPSIDPQAVTISGLVVDPVYGPASQGHAQAQALHHIDRDIAAPGGYPFTRGLFPEGYRTRLWTMRQFAGFGSADDTNKRFKYLLSQAKGTKANTGL